MERPKNYDAKRSQGELKKVGHLAGPVHRVARNDEGGRRKIACAWFGLIKFHVSEAAQELCIVNKKRSWPAPSLQTGCPGLSTHQGKKGSSWERVSGGDLAGEWQKRRKSLQTRAAEISAVYICGRRRILIDRKKELALGVVAGVGSAIAGPRRLYQARGSLHFVHVRGRCERLPGKRLVKPFEKRRLCDPLTAVKKSLHTEQLAVAAVYACCGSRVPAIAKMRLALGAVARGVGVYDS